MFQIYDGKPKEPKQKPVNLNLNKSLDGNVYLTVVDAEGYALDNGIIASFNPDGIMRLYSSLNKHIDIKTDATGCIWVERT